jgi:hypothetical protein
VQKKIKKSKKKKEKKSFKLVIDYRVQIIERRQIVNSQTRARTVFDNLGE